MKKTLTRFSSGPLRFVATLTLCVALSTLWTVTIGGTFSTHAQQQRHLPDISPIQGATLVQPHLSISGNCKATMGPKTYDSQVKSYYHQIILDQDPSCDKVTWDFSNLTIGGISASGKTCDWGRHFYPGSLLFGIGFDTGFALHPWDDVNFHIGDTWQPFVGASMNFHTITADFSQLNMSLLGKPGFPSTAVVKVGAFFIGNCQ